MAGYILGSTQRIGVGTAVSTLSTCHPVALAEQAALLDHVSAGRFRLGVGRGGPWVDPEVFGTGLDRYESGFAESLDLLLGALAGKPVSADGTFFRFREVATVPGPRTRPHPPVVVAATRPATAELAATRGLPVLLGMHMDDAAKQDMISHYANAAARHGVQPAGGHMAAVVARWPTPAASPATVAHPASPLAQTRPGGLHLHNSGRARPATRTPTQNCSAASTRSAPLPTAPKP